MTWSLLLLATFPITCQAFSLAPRRSADWSRRPPPLQKPPISPQHHLLFLCSRGGGRPRRTSSSTCAVDDHYPPLDGPRSLAAAPDGRSPRTRRRRRRKDSSVLPVIDDVGSTSGDVGITSGDVGGEEGASTTDSADGHDVEPATPRCPLFSATFPRYRIDLSSSYEGDESERRRTRRVRRGSLIKLVNPNSKTKITGEDERGGGLMSEIFGGVLKSGIADALSDAVSFVDRQRARTSVESLYDEEVKRGSFRWAPSSAGDASEGSPYQDEDYAAAAAFWRMASEVVVSHSARTTALQGDRYLALPETSRSVARNLCDIANWYADLSQERADAGGGGGIMVRAELDPQSDVVPVVRFTATTTRNYEQQQRQWREAPPLPTAEDTEKRTKAWVRRLLVRLGICPFTKSDAKSGQGLGDLGVPVASIMYRYSPASGDGGGGGVPSLMADAWEAISDMVAAGPSGRSGVSSILLSAPGFDNDFELWAGPVFAMLESGVGAIQAEEMVGVVCFHPRYVTPDGKSWPGFGHMHSVPRLKQWYKEHSLSYSSSSMAPPPLSDDEIAAGGAWQRRTPHAVINVLRAEQLEAAEGRRSSGSLYERNIRVLVGKDEGSVGLEKLAEDLKRERHLS